MLTVEKIGGTSMSSFGQVLDNIIIRGNPAANCKNRILVVSAYNGVTNLFLEHKKTGEPGVYAVFEKGGDYQSALRNLTDKLVRINRDMEDLGLDVKSADAAIMRRMDEARSYLESMADVLASGYIDRGNILLAVREILASIGEFHAAFNSVSILRSRGIDTTLVDLSGFHDSEYLSINARIHKMLKGIDFSKTLVIATGYTKGTEGIMREFDRGYSEVTFSKIAVEVHAGEAIIHKEFHLSSADPKIVGVENSIPVGNTNYDVADQLADIGMEAIHPKASKPLELNDINIRIKNTFEPDHPGTLISKGYIGPESRVEIIAGTDKVVAIEIHDPSMVGEAGFDRNMMEIFFRFGISYILKATNANSITTVIWDNTRGEELIAELKRNYEIVQVENVAVVCAIGSNIAKPGVLAKAARALADRKINVKSFSQSLRQVNMQFVIDRDRFEDAVRALNGALCL